MKTLGLERYGVLLLIFGFALYAGTAEFGLGMATARHISKSDDKRERSRILGASLLLSVPLALVAGALFACLSFPKLGIRFGLNSSMSAELENARVGLFLFGSSIVIFSVLNGVLYGLQRFVAINLINILSSALYLLCPATYAVAFGHDISGLISSVALGQWIIILVSTVVCHKMNLRPKLQGVDLELLRGLLRYGAWSTFGGTLHRLTNSIDRPLIGALVGAASIPIFAVPQSILSRSSMVVTALTGAVFPRLSQTEGTDAHAGLLDACYRSICSLAPLYILGIWTLPFFLKIWLGTEFAEQAITVAIVLAFAAWLDAIATVPYVSLLATQEIYKEGKLASLILIPNIALLCFGLLHFGVIGAATVAVLRSAAYLVGRMVITGLQTAPLFDIYSQSSLVILACILAMSHFEQPVLGVSLLLGVSISTIIMRRGPIVREAIQKFAFLRKSR